MESYLSLDITNGGLLYQIFYTAAFLIAYAILVYEGYRRKFPIVAWILILASIRLAVVIGTRLFAWSPEEWQYMLQNHILLPTVRKTMFGGFFLGVLAFLIVSRVLHFRHNAWDTVAYAMPAAVAVQSVGCFFYGCCFGTTSSLPWAVKYPVMSLAHYHQFESGLIHYGDTLSLPVHPVQLYETAGALLVVLLVFLFRKRWKAKGSLLLSSLVFFSVIRFVIEFFRDPLSNKTGGEMFIGIKVVQWQYIAFALLMLLILIWRERRAVRSEAVFHSHVPSLNTQISLMISLLLIFIVLRNWFTLPEAIALNIAILPALVLTAADIYKRRVTIRLRWAYAALLPFSLFLMSQTVPQTQIDTANNKTHASYHTVGGGFSTGSYTTERTFAQGSGCDRVTDEHYFNQQYTVGGIGYSHTKTNPESNVTITYGANLVAGKFSEANITDGGEVNKLLVDLGSYIKYDAKWLGIGAGLHIGNLFYNAGDAYRENISLDKGYFRTPVLPGAYLRVGPKRYFYADMHIADHFPVSSPGLSFLAGIGTGFGLRNGLSLNAGLSFIDEDTWYVSGYIPIENTIVIEPIFVWTGRNIFPEYPIELPEKQFSIGVSYRFGHK